MPAMPEEELNEPGVTGPISFALDITDVGMSPDASNPVGRPAGCSIRLPLDDRE